MSLLDSDTHVVGCLEPAVVSDVLAQRLPPVDLLAVHGVAAVLLRHARRPVLEGLQGGVLPPRPQVSLFVVLPSCGTEPWVGVGPGEAVHPQPLCCRGSRSRMGCGGGMGTGGCQGDRAPWVHAQGGRCPPAPVPGRLCLGFSHVLGSPGILQCLLVIPAQICDPKFPH